MRQRPTIRSAAFKKSPPEFEPVKRGVVFAESEAWDDLQTVAHYFIGNHAGNIAPQGLPTFVRRMRGAYWTTEPLTKYRVDQVNRLLAASAAAFDDPDIYKAVRKAAKAYSVWLDQLDREHAEEMRQEHAEEEEFSTPMHDGLDLDAEKWEPDVPEREGYEDERD